MTPTPCCGVSVAGATFDVGTALVVADERDDE
jgi:hypothetical protein